MRSVPTVPTTLSSPPSVYHLGTPTTTHHCPCPVPNPCPHPHPHPIHSHQSQQSHDPNHVTYNRFSCCCNSNAGSISTQFFLHGYLWTCAPFLRLRPWNFPQ